MPIIPNERDGAIFTAIDHEQDKLHVGHWKVPENLDCDCGQTHEDMLLLSVQSLRLPEVIVVPTGDPDHPAAATVSLTIALTASEVAAMLAAIAPKVFGLDGIPDTIPDQTNG